MKNQYFGDINDYRKYGLLRLLCGCWKGKSSTTHRVKTAICWMLTPDDTGRYGGDTGYLLQPQRWQAFDPELYQFLRQQVLQRGCRDVRTIEGSEKLLGDCRFYANELTNARDRRQKYFDEFLGQAHGSELVFFDPDIGMERPSQPLGDRGHLRWCEVARSFSEGHSLLVYQHFRRENREAFIVRMAGKFLAKTSAKCVHTFRTPNVVFFLIPQPKHEILFASVREEVNKTWGEQIKLQSWLVTEAVPALRRSGSQ